MRKRSYTDWDNVSMLPIVDKATKKEYVSSYTANALNQYEGRTTPGYAAVRGSVNQDASVAVNGAMAWQFGNYFYGGDDVENADTAVMKKLEIIAAYSNLYSAATGSVFVAESPEKFTYDDDGNLIADGRFTYAWDAENRLIGITTRDDLPPSVLRIRVIHRYDHQSRRIATTAAVWTNSVWQFTEVRSFTYDNWNEIAETISDNQSTTTNLYVWGLDLSGTLQGAGGIGGLLSATFDNTTTLYCYDTNGNVSQLIDPVTGDLLAHYEYDPFGNTVVAAGSLSKINPFRFSAKYHEDENGLVYYGYRFYSTTFGRFINRDLAGYLGGNNLFVFVGNNPCCRIDLLGLTDLNYYDVGGPYHQLVVKLGSDEWGTASAMLSYRLLKGSISTKKELDSSCSSCYHCVVTYKRDVEFYADKLKILLPNWTAYSSASTDEKKAWNNMITALTAHEQHHIDIYEEFNAIINIKGVGSDCLCEKAKQAALDAFKKKLESEFKTRVDENEKKQNQYDADTNHGVKEGVTLPQI